MLQHCLSARWFTNFRRQFATSSILRYCISRLFCLGYHRLSSMALDKFLNVCFLILLSLPNSNSLYYLIFTICIIDWEKAQVLFVIEVIFWSRKWLENSALTFLIFQCSRFSKTISFLDPMRRIGEPLSFVFVSFDVSSLAIDYTAMNLKNAEIQQPSLILSSHKP